MKEPMVLRFAAGEVRKTFRRKADGAWVTRQNRDEVVVEIEIDAEALRALARQAVLNKGSFARDGALRAQVVRLPVWHDVEAAGPGVSW